MLRIIQKIQEIQAKIDSYRPFPKELLGLWQEKLRIDWTYNSNALEGNTLTYGETAFFLREGLTSEGKPFKDYIEAKNHAEAIDFLLDVINGNRDITEGFIKELHALLTISGKIHKYTDPIHVKDEMEELIKWLNKQQKLSTIEKACAFHYRFVAIHPFDDGNGRMARLLMNLILIKAKYPPCIIKQVNRRKYLETLENIDLKKDYQPFIEFICTELLSTQQTMLDVVSGKIDTLENYPEKMNRIEREEKILQIINSKPISIGQIVERIPQIKRPTLKNDLGRLLKSKKIKRTGSGKAALYIKA